MIWIETSWKCTATYESKLPVFFTSAMREGVNENTYAKIRVQHRKMKFLRGNELCYQVLSFKPLNKQTTFKSRFMTKLPSGTFTFGLSCFNLRVLREHRQSIRQHNWQEELTSYYWSTFSASKDCTKTPNHLLWNIE